MADGDKPVVTMHKFGKGMGVYMSSFKHGEINNRTLLNLILTAAGESLDQLYMTDNLYTECCYYPEGKQLVIINNSDKEQKANENTEAGVKEAILAPFDTFIIEL